MIGFDPEPTSEDLGRAYAGLYSVLHYSTGATSMFTTLSLKFVDGFEFTRKCHLIATTSSSRNRGHPKSMHEREKNE